MEYKRDRHHTVFLDCNYMYIHVYTYIYLYKKIYTFKKGYGEIKFIIW